MHLKRKILGETVQFIGSDYFQTKGRLSIRNYFLTEINPISGDKRIGVAKRKMLVTREGSIFGIGCGGSEQDLG